MKKIYKKMICFLLTACVLSSLLCANAVMARSSPTMSYFSARLTAYSNEKVSISADITGRDFCSKIGISRVYIYESNNGGKTFSLYDTYFSSDYPSMMDSGITYSKTPISFTGTIGHQYKATVYCCAVNDSGDDTKTYETNVVTARR